MAHYIATKRKYYDDLPELQLSEESSDDESNVVGPPSAKKPYENYSATSLRMMSKMGFKGDTGLGRDGQGRLKPVEVSTQKGRRGLGLKLDDLDSAADKWTPDMENIQLRETFNFLSNNSNDLLTTPVEKMRKWMIVGSKKLTIENESKFCDPEVLSDVLAQKTIFDHLGADDMRNARTRSNPFETINKAIFMNRAAVKMANIDAMFEFMFTSPKDEDGNDLVKEHEPLYFADVCAGPGGFSEYVLWRKKWHAKGIGFTLKCDNDFKTDKFLAGHPETFDTYYGKKDDGNVYDPDNIESLTDYVLKQTISGVHFMMSDGGFSVEGQENVQEILSKQLYLCQCLTALSIVRVDGHFVTKLFDVFTPFSVGLIYLMYKCFKQICIVKPNTSRPANSERYLICKWKKPNTDAIRQYLFDVNKKLYENKQTNKDVVELVPHSVIRHDQRFFKYICDSNDTIGRNQVAALLKIAHYSKDEKLKEPQQEDLKRASLEIWNVPNQRRQKSATKPKTEKLFNELLDGWSAHKEFLTSPEYCITAKTSLRDAFYDKSDWVFVPIEAVENTGKTIRTFFMSRGNGDVYKYTDAKTWAPLTEVYVEITPNTLFYGEIVKELTGEGAAQTFVYALHIIDGIVLGGVDIRNFDVEKRNRLCMKFAAALNKPPKNAGLKSDRAKFKSSIRCKALVPLLYLQRFLCSMTRYRLKDKQTRLGLLVKDTMNPRLFYVPRGILLLKITKPNLYKHFDDRSQEHVYTDESIQPKRTFMLKDLRDPNDIYSSFKSTFTNRLIWKWVDPRQVAETFDKSMLCSNNLYRLDFENYVYDNY